MGFATQMAVGVTARSPTPGASWVAPTDSARPAPMRQSFPSPGVVTQAAFRPTAIDPTEPGSTDARRTILPERSSKRTTEPSTPSTQTPAIPVATAAAGTSRIVSVIAPVVASARTTEKSGAIAQRASSETREVIVDEVRRRPSLAGQTNRRPLRARGRIQACHRRRHGADELRVGQRPPVGNPDRPGAERDVRRRRAGRERLDDPGGRNDAKHSPRVRIHEPERAVADRERGRSASGRDAAHDLARPCVDAHHGSLAGDRGRTGSVVVAQRDRSERCSYER